MNNQTKARILKLHVFKYNPLDSNDRPKLKIYEIEETPGMTIFVALNFIRDRLDHSLQIGRASCRERV